MYKKHTESSSFRICQVATDALRTAQSYYITIANADLDSEIAVISWAEYSNTTSGQISALYGNCPANWLLIRGQVAQCPTPQSIRLAVKAAAQDAIAYFADNTQYKVKTAKYYNMHLVNLENILSHKSIFVKTNPDAKLYDKIQEVYKAANNAKMQKIAELDAKRGTLLDSKTLSERQAEKKAHYDSLLAKGISRIIARKKARWVEDEDRDCFIWSGKESDAVRTNKGIIFTIDKAKEILQYEDWQIGKTILNRFNFISRENGVYIIGCHKIREIELAELRRLILALPVAA